MRWTLHALGILVLATVVGMNLVGPQAFVAERNLERATNPALVPPGGRSGLDAGYLIRWATRPCPAIVAAYPRCRSMPAGPSTRSSSSVARRSGPTRPSRAGRR